MLSRALYKAKREGGKKVAINFQVPIELKEEFEKLCKTNKVSVTGMLNGLIETALEEAQGIHFEFTPETLLSLNNRINELESELANYFAGDEPTEDFLSLTQDPHSIDEILTKKAELERLTMIFKQYERSQNDSNN